MATAISIFACTTPQSSTPSADDATMSAYKENAKVIESGFKAFAKNDLAEFATYVSDTVKFYGPGINDTAAIGKAALLERLAGFHKILKNVNANIVALLPGIDSVTLKPDGAVRSYVYWESESAINGTKFNQKFYAFYKLNKDHKIVEANEFFDASGLIAAATAPKK